MYQCSTAWRRIRRAHCESLRPSARAAARTASRFFSVTMSILTRNLSLPWERGTEGLAFGGSEKSKGFDWGGADRCPGFRSFGKVGKTPGRSGGTRAGRGSRGDLGGVATGGTAVNRLVLREEA